jgi:2-polyprenyl-3-methyl-5-hydroxy-6-metoxy-1,4-benzoquinol methylase
LTTVIRTRRVPECPLCSSRGEELYTGLRDHLFDAPGEWGFRRCTRPDCGLIWLDPAPTPEDLGLAYRHYYTHEAGAEPRGSLLSRALGAVRDAYVAARYKYPGKSPPMFRPLMALPLHLFPGRRADADHRVMHLEAHRRGRVLDVGCGSGALLENLRALGWGVQGMDFDPAAVQVARSRGFEVGLGSIESQRYPDRRFDAVTMSHVVEHVEDPRALFAEARRILRPGGVLVVATPNSESLGHARFGSAWRGLEPPRHLQIFSACTLERVVWEAGMHPLSVRTSVHWATGIFLESEAIRTAARGGPRTGFDRAKRMRAGIESLRESLLLLGDPLAGEELIVIAERPEEDAAVARPRRTPPPRVDRVRPSA